MLVRNDSCNSGNCCVIMVKVVEVVVIVTYLGCGRQLHLPWLH